MFYEESLKTTLETATTTVTIVVTNVVTIFATFAIVRRSPVRTAIITRSCARMALNNVATAVNHKSADS
jgi:hypothetical protein